LRSMQQLFSLPHVGKANPHRPYRAPASAGENPVVP
jgi:hypothetical protein